MNDEEIFKNIKEEYINTNPGIYLRMHGWEGVSANLTDRKPKPFFSYRLAFIAVLVILLAVGPFVLFKVAKAAMPGSILYPVKLLSERIITKTTGSTQVEIDNRANEIVVLSKQKEADTQALEKVVIEYKDAVQKNLQKIEASGVTDQKFEKKLEEHHQEFDNAAKNSPEVQKEIKDALEVSDTHKGED